MQSIKLLKANNKNYLFGTFTNRWIDREGQIITDEAHKDLIQFLDAHPERSPALWFWHMPDMEFSNKAEWWTYQNGFVSMLWELTTNEAEFIEKFAQLHEVGMSHGFTAELDNDGDITKYRPFEASILPIDKAANSNTSLEILKKEREKMNDKFLELVRTIGKEQATALIEQLDTQEAQLESAEIATKETNEDEPVPVVEETEDTTIIDEAELVQTLQERDGQIDDMLADMRQQIGDLQTAIETINKSLSRSKANGSTRASLASYRQTLGNGSVVGNPSAQVDGRSTLAKSQPTQADTKPQHALNGLFSGGK